MPTSGSVVPIRYDTLLVCKTGNVVVTGRTVYSGPKGQIRYEQRAGSSRPAEQVHGIIPAVALDGFYFWSGRVWEPCEEVMVHATSVTVGSKTLPAYYKFVGLRSITTNQLIVRTKSYETLHEFFELRGADQLLPEDHSLPVVETAVHKRGWWTEREKDSWLEPNVKIGIAPRLAEVLTRINEVSRDQEFPNGVLSESDLLCQMRWEERKRILSELEAKGITIHRRHTDSENEVIVRITITGETFEMEYRTGRSGGGRLGLPGDPAGFIVREPGCTYFGYSKQWNQHPGEPALVAFSCLVNYSGWLAGPYEERRLKETGGLHYARHANAGIGNFEYYCGHGWKVGDVKFENYSQPAGLENREKCLHYPPTVMYWPSECPFGCSRHSGGMPTPLAELGDKEAETLGVQSGLHPISVYGIPGDYLESFRTRNQSSLGDNMYGCGWHPTNDGRFVAVGSFTDGDRVYLGTDRNETQQRSRGVWPKDEMGRSIAGIPLPNSQTEEEARLTQAFRRIGLIR